MQHTTHDTAVHGGFSARLIGFVLAGALQAGLIWALVAGLDIKTVTRFIPDPFKVTLTKQPEKLPEAPQATIAQPSTIIVPRPDVEIAGGEPGENVIQGVLPIQPPVAGPRDHGPVTVAGTHTIPPYPPIEARLGNQGIVYLRLVIGADGVIQEAVITRSSGAEGLDLAALNWVRARWRYQPAIRGGVAVPSVVNVAVKFDLKNAS